MLKTNVMNVYSLCEMVEMGERPGYKYVHTLHTTYTYFDVLEHNSRISVRLLFQMETCRNYCVAAHIWFTNINHITSVVFCKTTLFRFNISFSMESKAMEIKQCGFPLYIQ